MNTLLKPSVIAFDVNETLIDITTLEPFFRRLFGNSDIMREWFAQLILYSEAITLSGKYVPFSDLAAGVIRMIGAIRKTRIEESDIKELRELMLVMPAHPDVEGALIRLYEVGFRLVTLTNSASASMPGPLERAGLSKYFERSFSVESVQRFKPAPETYRLVARALDVDTTALCMVAAHAWDILGAQAAGCTGALITLPGNAALPVPGLPQPDIVATDVSSVADKILRRWR